MVDEPLEEGRCECEDRLRDVPCGCGEDPARLYRDEVVHWRGEHWRVGCAFDALLEEVDRLEEGLEIIAGDPDREGVSHGSRLHDVIQIGRFAERVLEGQTASEALSR